MEDLKFYKLHEKVNFRFFFLMIVLCFQTVYSQVNCNNNNGIMITANGLINGEIYQNPVSSIICNPNAAFAGQTGSWTGNVSGGTLTYTFSQPIISATVSWSAVDNSFDLDVGQIAIDGAGIMTLAGACGATINGNQLTCNLQPTFPQQDVVFGDVSVTVNSTCPFTTITLTNVSNTNGWVQGNPCNFNWIGPCDNLNPPILSTNTLSNQCPNNTVDLDSIIVSNLPLCYNMTWHLGAPATNNNRILNVSNVGAGTYYAAFAVTSPGFSCYGPTTEITVVIDPCNSDCLPDETLVSPINNMTNLLPNAIKHIERENFIVASNIIGFGDFEFQDGVVYKAGEFIVLDEGFEAERNSQFTAYIDECETDFVFRNQDNNEKHLEEEIVNNETIIYEDFRIIPNPSDRITEISSRNSEFNKIQLLSSFGEEILYKDLKASNNFEIDISNFPDGIYFVRIGFVNGKMLTKKLIKN